MRSGRHMRRRPHRTESTGATVRSPAARPGVTFLHLRHAVGRVGLETKSVTHLTCDFAREPDMSTRFDPAKSPSVEHLAALQDSTATAAELSPLATTKSRRPTGTSWPASRGSAQYGVMATKTSPRGNHPRYGARPARPMTPNQGSRRRVSTHVTPGRVRLRHVVSREGWWRMDAVYAYLDGMQVSQEVRGKPLPTT